MKRLLQIVLLITCFILQLSSCSSLFEPANDNAQLYGSEWSTSSEDEGLKFYKDNSVLYFSSYNRGSGMFEYDAASGIIIFDGLSATFPSFTSEMPGAEILDDVTMKLYWHELGKSANYYMILYRRR